MLGEKINVANLPHPAAKPSQSALVRVPSGRRRFWLHCGALRAVTSLITSHVERFDRAVESANDALLRSLCWPGHGVQLQPIATNFLTRGNVVVQVAQAGGVQFSRFPLSREGVFPLPAPVRFAAR